MVESERWYAQRSPSAAVAFIAELGDALDLIARTAETWPRYRRSTRRFVLRRFPFRVVYRIEDEVI